MTRRNGTALALAGFLLLVGCTGPAGAPQTSMDGAADRMESARPERTSDGDDGGEASDAVRPLATARPEEVGMDPRKLRRVDELLMEGIAGGASPGAALAVGRHGRIVKLQGYGRLDWREGFGPVTDSTIYDLASLTKVLATTTAVMMLVDEGRLELDSPLSSYLPEWTGSEAKERVTLRHLLTHTAGLPPFKPFWRKLRGKDEYLEHIARMKLDYEPGAKTVYSDIGLMLTGFVVERITGRPINEFLRERVFGPLGLRDTGYSPLQTGWAERLGIDRSRVLRRIAPTEMDTVFRHRHVHGAVHDENAYAMGGVAGHAGLFSSARDLAVIARMLMNGGTLNGRRYIREATLEAFTTRQGPGSTRALGWDTPGGRSSAGDFFSSRSFGHTGFTGTSFWVDKERDVFVVLLTNRVNPTRNNHAHVELRRAVHDAVQQAITDMPVRRRADEEASR